ncbi:MAG: hypothetical protein LUQ04_04565 [Methanoregula sp.]|nr:hypothetical protein [Methanoregula sp.]
MEEPITGVLDLVNQGSSLLGQLFYEIINSGEASVQSIADLGEELFINEA